MAPAAVASPSETPPSGAPGRPNQKGADGPFFLNVTATPFTLEARFGCTFYTAKQLKPT